MQTSNPTISQLGYEAKRRQKLAEVLGKGSDRQVTSNMDGLAKVLQMGLSGYQTRKGEEATKAFDTAKTEALQKALDPSRSRDQRIADLSNVPGYEGEAVKASLDQPEATALKDQAEQALISQASGQALSPQQQAALQAYDKLRQTERMYDPRQNVVPKYSPLADVPGSTPSSPQLVAPGAQLLPPPAAGQTPDPSMFPATPSATMQPPAGLDAKGQGIFMDEMARAQAEKALNGGVPKMTETQQQASSRSSLISSGLKSLGSLMDSPQVSGGRMAIADTVGMAGPIGQYAAQQIRSPEEQKFTAGRDSALEGMASAVTGAGVTQDQFARFTNMLPSPADDPSVRPQKLVNAYDFLLTQTKIAGPVANEIAAAAAEARAKIKAPAPSGGLTPEEQRELQELEKLFGGR